MKLRQRSAAALSLFAFLLSFVVACSCGARTTTTGPESIGPDTWDDATLDLKAGDAGRPRRGRIGVGVGLGLDDGPTFDPRSLSGLHSYFHAEDAFWAATTPGAQANYVPRIGDISGHARTISAGSNGASPLLDASAFGTGVLSLQITAARSAYLQPPTAQASDWTFLHNGTGATMVAVVRPASGNARCTVYNTSGTLFSQGVVLYHDGVNDRFVFEIRKGSGTLIATVAGANGSAPKNANYVVVATYDESAAPRVHLVVNGVDVTGTTSSAPSSSAPAFGGLCVGRLQATGLDFLEAYWRMGAFYTRALSSAEIAQVSAGALALHTPRSIRHILTIGDSITAATLYQQELWLRSLASSTRFDRINFLGTSLAGEVGLFTDRQHNGHIGANIQTITTDVQGIGALDYTPDLVIVMAGTNNAGADLTTTETAYVALHDLVRSKWPTATVGVMRPPRRLDDPAKGAMIESFAGWERDTLVPQRQALGQSVIYLNGDVNADASMQIDGVHPANATGYVEQGDHVADGLGY